MTVIQMSDDDEPPDNPALDRAIEIIIASLRSGGTVYACGNGGSDAHAGHLVAELVGRFAYDRPPLRAVHLSSGGPVGSCIANDYGWEQVFARQVWGLCTDRDVLVCFTTSGRSENITHAARDRTGPTVVLCGPVGLVHHEVGPDSVEVRSSATTTPAIQEDHQAWVHEIARRVEQEMFPR